MTSCIHASRRSSCEVRPEPFEDWSLPHLGNLSLPAPCLSSWGNSNPSRNSWIQYTVKTPLTSFHAWCTFPCHTQALNSPSAPLHPCTPPVGTGVAVMSPWSCPCSRLDQPHCLRLWDTAHRHILKSCEMWGWTHFRLLVSFLCWRALS